MIELLEDILDFFLSCILLLIYIPIFSIVLIFAIFGSRSCIDWCQEELDYWDDEEKHKE